MTWYNLIFAGLIWILAAGLASAQPSTEKILPLDAKIAEDGQSIELNWFDAKPPRVGSVTVKRRLYRQAGGQSWKTIAEGLGPVMRYTDDTIRPGTAYEYQILRTARDIVDVGYWLAGTEIPARAQRGTAYVIVDETIAEAIAPRLARFERDLIGDGWTVVQHITPRGDARKPVENLKTAVLVKEWLRARYNEDPFGQHSIILVGHVPIIKSGQVAPDGHGNRPHPTDLFYADMDGRWSILRSGELLDSRVPSDFIEMQVGRIDFSPLSEGHQETEIRLLRAYFDKNHHWRMGYLGNLKDAYGTTGHFDVERAGLRNIVGADNLTTGGHHDVGEEKPWLWGVSGGDPDGSRYASEYTNQSVFALNFGSHKQFFDGRSNAMTALLSQPWYSVAVGWGARPAWWPHHMALGGSIGDVHMRTVNNGQTDAPYRETMDYFPTGRYLMRNGIWVNLLGDPTLRSFPLAPPHHVVVHAASGGVKLSWQASPDPNTLGYHVFRSSEHNGAFQRLTGSKPTTALAFFDKDAGERSVYMVRAYGLKEVYAGSFYTYSQGVYAADETLLETDNVPAEMTLREQQPLHLPVAFDKVQNNGIYSFITGPSKGTLRQNKTGWIYTPPPDFKGEIGLRYSVSLSGQTVQKTLRLNSGH